MAINTSTYLNVDTQIPDISMNEINAYSIILLVPISRSCVLFAHRDFNIRYSFCIRLLCQMKGWVYC